MQSSAPASGPDIRNLLLAILLATSVMLAWQYFYERPRIAAQHAAEQEKRAKEQASAPKTAPAMHKADGPVITGPRIRIDSPSLHGSIPLTGGRFDDITLAKYTEALDDTKQEVKLLTGSSGPAAYFAEIGVLPGHENIRVPDSSTQWRSNGDVLSPGKPVTLTWSNGQGLTFERKIEIDENYMFTVTTTVKNSSGSNVSLYPYGLVSRNYEDTGSHFAIMHEGPLGVAGGVLEDLTYKSLREDGAQKFSGADGWVGITDKYWLTALIPAGEGSYDTEYKHFKRGDADAYQSDIRASELSVPAGGSASFTMRLFAGAKVVESLDAYMAEHNIPLFDRAVDFGSLYFLTKPIFLLMNYFHSIVGNFGVAILLLTVVIKIILFPLASKSMTAMARTKKLMPKMQEIKERYKDDKMKMNQEIMAMYKREKVNPVAGCLPILLQIPVFYSLYRVLFVTIEMRHAPFFGWIHDLSVADPTNLFTLFGLIPWVPPHFMHLGVWPLIMCATMYIQQQLNPKPADEVQAMVMRYMPFMFLFLFANFPAGLVIYWAWNNTLTILQQLYINHKLDKKGLR